LAVAEYSINIGPRIQVHYTIVLGKKFGCMELLIREATDG
jgi:hypothetical protein